MNSRLARVRRATIGGLVVAAVLAFFPAAQAPATAASVEPIPTRGPATGSVWPVASTVLLEAHSPWSCADCTGTQQFVIATDPAMSKIVGRWSGACPPAAHPTCPFYAAVGPFSPGIYYWRVDVLFDDGAYHTSEVWSFMVTHDGNGSTSFTDPPGDAHGAPDVTAVQVVEGLSWIRIGLSIPGLTRLDSDEDIWMGIDADQNGGTGNVTGADYLFRLNGETGSYGFWRWAGDDWAWAATPGNVIWYGSGGVVATLDRATIGEKTPGFNFWVETRKGTGETSVPDFAPDASEWNVQLLAAATVPTITVMAVSSVPRNPIAGATFHIRVPALTLSNGSYAPADSVTCRAVLASRTIAPGGACTFRIPATAARKRLVVRVTATYGTTNKSRVLTFVVRPHSAQRS